MAPPSFPASLDVVAERIHNGQGRWNHEDFDVDDVSQRQISPETRLNPRRMNDGWLGSENGSLARSMVLSNMGNGHLDLRRNVKTEPVAYLYCDSYCVDNGCAHMIL